MPTLKRLPRPLRWLGLGLCYLVLGLIALVALVLVTVNIPIVNEALARKVTSALEPSFEGRLVFHRLGHVDFGGVLGAEVEVMDPAGRSVLAARDVDVRVFWPALVWRIVTNDSDVTSIDIDRVAVEHVRVGLVDDGTGAPTLAQAFEPREPEAEPAEPGGGTSVTLEEIRVRAVEVRGALQSPGPIDADLANLEASLESGPQGLHLVLAGVEVTARQLPVVDRLTGKLTADVTLPAELEPGARAPRPAPSAAGERTTTTTYALRPAAPPPRRITAAFTGDVAGSGASARVRMLGAEILAEVEAPALSPDTLQHLAPGLAPKAPAALAARVEGALSDFGFDARVNHEQATVAARGRVRQANATSTVQAHVDVARVNLARLLADGADTELGLVADAELSFDAKGGKGDYRATSKGSRFGAERLPEARVRGEIALPSEQPIVTTGTLNVDEPGAPTQLTYRVESGDAGTRAKVSSHTKLSRPARLAELTGGLAADGVLTAQAELDAPNERLDASFSLDLARVKHPQVAVRRAHVQGRAWGDVALPKLDLTLNLAGVSAGGRTFSELRAAARGSPNLIAVSARAEGAQPDSVVLTAAVRTGSELIIQRPELTVIDERGTLHVEAQRIVTQNGGIQVDALTLEGPGRAELTLRYGPSLERLVLETQKLDPARVLDILGVKSPLHRGELDIRADVSRAGGLPRGKLQMGLSDLAVGKLRCGQGRADLAFERGKLSGTAELELARGAKTTISVKDVKLPLNGTNAEMRALTGDVSLDGEIDLEQLEDLLPVLGLERAEGKVRFDVGARRPSNGGSPTLRAHLETKSLVIVQERVDAAQTQSAEQARSSSPLWLRGIDAKLDAELADGRASLDAKVFDRQGDVVRVSAEWKGLSGITGDLRRLTQRLEQAPFTAKVEVPERAFEKWPAPIRPTEIAGIFSFGMEAEGTLRAPNVRARGRVQRFGAAVERRGAPRLDLELGAEYAQAGGRVSLRAHDRRRALLDLASSWSGDVARLGAPEGGKSPIAGNFSLALDEFPIEIVPALENRQIRGKVSGDVRLDDFGKDARLNLDLTARGLRVDRVRVDDVKASVRAQDGKLLVDASLGGGAGSASAKLETGFSWKDRLVPTLDEQLTGSVRTEDFRLSALQPLLEGSVSELDGKLDADVRAVVEDGQPRLSGRVQLEAGVMQVPSIGQQFRNMSALVTITPGAIELEKLRARGTSGGFEADGRASLEGLTPETATFSVRIGEDDKLPLTVEGEAVGDGWGTIVADYVHDEENKRNELRVNLRKFNVELPQSPPKGIQDLNQPEHIRVGFHRRDGDFVVIPLQPMKEPGPPSEYQTVVIVELGSVRVEKGQQVQVALGGEVRATIGEELNVEGKIESRRGELDISGKQFDIERATVTFTGGKPDDPTISAVARYDSPDGYVVYAEYSGTVSRGKLRLSSEPPLTQDEILTLLLFGSPDGSAGAGTGSNLATAVSVVGGTATQGLNRALSDITDLDVSARIDTSTGAPRPELVLQLSSRVAARVTQALGEPTPGQSPDRTFLTVELRLASSWSLSTMIGDRGASAVNLIWRRRY